LTWPCWLAGVGPISAALSAPSIRASVTDAPGRTPRVSSSTVTCSVAVAGACAKAPAAHSQVQQKSVTSLRIVNFRLAATVDFQSYLIGSNFRGSILAFRR
jgi:hypothetical protein